MSISQLAGLALRHWIAVLVVLILTVAVAVGFRHTAPLYQDSGNVEFSAAASGGPNSPRISTDNLIITGDLIVHKLNTPMAAQLIRRAGGAGQYQFGLVNFYNEQYPNYSEPLATLATTSANPSVASATFMAALRVIQQELLIQQTHDGLPASVLITAQLVDGSSGPVALSGSPKRTDGALVLLAVIVAYFTATLLDRHPGWRRHLRRATGQPQGPVELLAHFFRSSDLPRH